MPAGASPWPARVGVRRTLHSPPSPPIDHHLRPPTHLAVADALIHDDLPLDLEEEAGHQRPPLTQVLRGLAVACRAPAAGRGASSASGAPAGRPRRRAPLATSSPRQQQSFLRGPSPTPSPLHRPRRRPRHVARAPQDFAAPLARASSLPDDAAASALGPDPFPSARPAPRALASTCACRRAELLIVLAGRRLVGAAHARPRLHPRARRRPRRASASPTCAQVAAEAAALRVFPRNRAPLGAPPPDGPGRGEARASPWHRRPHHIAAPSQDERAANSSVDVLCDSLRRPGTNDTATKPRRRCSEARRRCHDGTVRRDRNRRRAQRACRLDVPGPGGLKVLVLERRPMVGGACVTEELFPGYRLSSCSYICHLLQERVIRDLDLPRHGFEVFPLEPARLPPVPGRASPRRVGGRRSAPRRRSSATRSGTPPPIRAGSPSGSGPRRSSTPTSSRPRPPTRSSRRVSTAPRTRRSSRPS